MTAIEKICDLLHEKATFSRIQFRHAATNTKVYPKGYAFRMPLSSDETHTTEVLTLEPCNYSNGDKWHVYGSLVSRYHGIHFYAKNLPDAKNKIKLMFKKQPYCFTNND